jgi:hypothetical protein
MLQRQLGQLNGRKVCQVKSKSKFCYHRLLVDQSILVSSPHLGPNTRFLFLSVAGLLCGSPSLTRGRVCRLQLLLTLARAVILGPESRWTQDNILLNPPTLKARTPHLYPPATGWPSYTPRHWVPFSSSLTVSQGYGGGIRTHLHAGLEA